MKNGIITLGEALIDFIPMDENNEIYQKSPGGAPANVAVGVSRLGAKSTFIGKVGNDMFGNFLKQTLQENGVHPSLTFSDEYRTAIVFVELDKNKERSFSFYIKQPADQMLSEKDIDKNLFKDHKIFHFGTISLKSHLAKEATFRAIQYAKNENMIISFDPNVRVSLWDDPEQLKTLIFQMLDKIDVLKISEEELMFLTESTSHDSIKSWMNEYNLSLVFLTRGENGSYVFTKNGADKVDAIQVSVEDTTGAGDGFVAGMLYQLNHLNKSLNELSLDDSINIGRFASVTGGLVTTKKGAMSALPTLDEVQGYMKKM